MRVRIKFTKNEIVKYLGHLDIMRSFQRNFNRADVRMTYSEGFNPHQKMSFALPLGVGIASIGEYLDAEIADGQDLDAVCRRLNEVSGLGFDILAVRELQEGAEKAMAAVKYASYSIAFDKEYDLLLDEYLNRDQIIIQKKTKTGIKDVNIKDLTEKISLDSNVLKILLKAGSENNIKPELIAEDLFKFSGIDYKRDMISITRNELFAANIIPLIDYQTL